MPGIAAPRSREAAATRSGSSKWVVASTIARRVRSGSEDLKMPEPTKFALGAQLHHQRGVGGGGDAAGAEQDDGQPAALGDVADQLERRLQFLGGGGQLRLARATGQALRISPVIMRMWRTASTTLPVPASPFERIMAAPSRDAAQRLAEVGGAADERHLEGPLVDVVGLVGRA